MDHSCYSKFKTAVLVLALITVSACSSSQVDDAAIAPPETAGDNTAIPDAKTDVVPPPATGEDPNAIPPPPTDAMAANTPPPPPDASAVNPDPNALPPPPDALVVANTPPPVSIEAPITDAPPTKNFTSDTASMNTPPPPVSETPEATDGVRYKVKRGDTLMKVAFENYGDLYRWKEIYESNRSRIQDPNHVPPGTQLILNGAGMVTIERNGDKYLIKHGDTLGIISDDVYGTRQKWKKLWENNRQLIKDPNKIYAGFYLYYQPESRLTHDKDAPAPVKEHAATEKDGGSAAISTKDLPFKNQANEALMTTANHAALATAATTDAAPQAVQRAVTDSTNTPAVVPTAPAARVPASK